MSPSTMRMDGRPGPRHSGPPCDPRRKAEGRGPGVRKVTAARTPWPLLAHPSSLPPSLSSPLSTCRVPRGLGIAVHWCVTVYAAGAGWLGSSGPLAQRGEFRDRAWGSLPVRGPARLEFEGAAGEGQEGSPGQCHVRRHPVPLPQLSALMGHGPLRSGVPTTGRCSVTWTCAGLSVEGSWHL